jgi:hypothetical protein
LSLTECTECTELTLRVPSGFDLSPTDFLTRLLLCSAIRVNSIALAYRNKCTDCSDFFFFFLITRFARDFVLTRHNPNKFGFCSRLLQNSLFDFVKNRSSDLHRVYSLCSFGRLSQTSLHLIITDTRTECPYKHILLLRTRQCRVPTIEFTICKT